jgi:serine/threonine-protein kinase
VSDVDLRGVILEDRYQVDEQLAEGAMGSVWRGERLKLGRAVAIKIMHEELPDELASRQRFEREAKLMARLEHPNCVSVIDFGVHDGKPFLVMDLVRGTSLQELMDREKRMDPPRAAEIMKQVLSGLAHAHELGIVHRDIKPANIMVGDKAGIGMQVRILDFGLARPAQTSTKLTTGIVVGTPNYMSPEQCRGGDIDGRCDLYACGVILFELLTGRKPFLADDPIQVVRMHMNQAPPRLADIVPGDYGDFEAVVARALAKDPGGRYATAQDMVRALDAALASKRSLGHAVPFAPSSARPSAPQVATMSGWSVPAETSAAQAAADRASGLGPRASGPESGAAAAAAVAVPASASASASTSAPAAATASPPRPATAPPARPAIGVPPPPFSTAPGAASNADTVADPDAAAKAQAAAAAELAASGRGPMPEARGPSSTPGPSPTLPFSRKQLLIAGGGLLGVILLIAILAGGGGSSKSTSTPARDAASGHPAPDPAPSADLLPGILADANDRVASGDREGALSSLLRARRDYPESAAVPLLLGRIYFSKLYWTDGIKNFRDAIHLDPSLRSDPELIKAALRGFITTPSVERELETFLREDIGAAAVPYLEETARDHPNPTIRSRAAAELKRLQ